MTEKPIYNPDRSMTALGEVALGSRIWLFFRGHREPERVVMRKKHDRIVLVSIIGGRKKSEPRKRFYSSMTAAREHKKEKKQPKIKWQGL